MQDQIVVVQASLIGSILVNLLLILGSAILVGGVRYQEQEYNSTATDLSATLLCLSAFSLVIPVCRVLHRVDVTDSPDRFLPHVPQPRGS